MATIVMTGGSSGFGAVAAERMARSGPNRLLLGGRTPATAGESLRLDMTELAAVRAFATSVRDRLAAAPVDALVLNAGVVRPDAASRTKDGFETTFAVNHLAHYLLVRLLMPVLADEAIIVATTSGTHDPATKAGLALPRHADAGLLAHPDRDPDRDATPARAGQHAYTASKLCVVLTVRALSQHPGLRTRRIRAVAYDPGQVFGTGLARDLSPARRIAWKVLGSPVGSPLHRLSPTVNSRQAAGQALADLSLGLESPPPGRHYAALRRGRLTWPDPSEKARNDDLADTLWRSSAELTGLPGS